MPYWKLFYHLVWSTKYHLPLIESAWEPDLYGYIRGKASALGCHIHANGGMPDHIHVVITVPPKLALATVTGQIKGASSHHINQKYLRNTFAWQNEYGAFSFSEGALSSVIGYVNNQKKHYADNTLDEFMESSPERA